MPDQAVTHAADRPRGNTFIGLPLYGVDGLFFQCVLTMMSRDLPTIGVGAIQTNIGDSSPTRARNTLTAQFLASPFDQLLMIDSDILFTPEDVQRICSHKELVVGGFYPKKDPGKGDLVINTFDAKDMQPKRPDGLQRMKYMGAGFLRIKREAFEIMINKMGPQIVYHPDETEDGRMDYAFWQEGPYQYPDGSRRFLTEDWRFCQICNDLGISVWADTGILLGHRGPTVFPLESQKARICGIAPAPGDPASIPLPIEAKRAPIPLPVGFKYPKEAGDDAKEILAGIYHIPGLRDEPLRVLDAGAHCGLFSYWAAKRWPNCKVTAIEPVAANFDLLLKNLNGAGNVNAINSAIYNHNSNLTMRKGINSLCSSAEYRCARGDAFTVPCVDASAAGKFDFIKLDIEGSEHQVLTALDLSETKAVVVESHWEDERIKIRQYLESQGFVCLWDSVTLDACRLIKFARPEALLPGVPLWPDPATAITPPNTMRAITPEATKLETATA